MTTLKKTKTTLLESTLSSDREAFMVVSPKLRIILTLLFVLGIISMSKAFFAGSVKAAVRTPVAINGVCYEVFDLDSGWTGPLCNGSVITTTGGIGGIDITLQDGGPTQVCYIVHSKNNWQPRACNGEPTGTLSDPIDAIDILLAPRPSTKNLCYDVTDKASAYFHDCNGRTAGDKITTLMVLSIKIS